MRRFVPLVLMCCVGLALFDAASAQSARETTPEDAAWEEVNSLNRQSNEEFLKKFPAGKHADEAKLAMALQDKFAAISKKNAKPRCTIPFKTLGPRWRSWQKRNPGKGVVGYFAKKGKPSPPLTGTTLGWFAPLKGGRTPGLGSVSTDERGMLISPTGAGSIIAFSTDGLKYEFLSGVIIETPGGIEEPGDQPIFFSVLEGIGLVHLAGAGKVIFPNGKVCETK